MTIQSKVYILYTGGTIGMEPKDSADPYSPLEPKPLSRILKFIPGSEIKKDDQKPDRKKTVNIKLMNNQKGQSRKVFDKKIKISYSEDGKETFHIPRNHNIVEIKIGKPLILDNKNEIYFGSGSFEHPVDSSDICPEDWKIMAQMIDSVYDDYDAFIILHGTDTMAFTSSGLSFIFENLGKPVIITGSQLPISGTRTDAVLNLVNAIYIGGYKATDLPLIPEVIIVFADKIIRGCRATKVSANDWAGFDSPNFPLLGTIGEHININTNHVMPAPPSNKNFFIKTDLSTNVFNISVFPGFNNKQMEKILLDSDIKGIIIRTYGTGNVPNNKKFLNKIERAIKKEGKLIVNITQCVKGMIEMGRYEASSGLLEKGVISGFDMTKEAALAKMMWILGTQSEEDITTQMQISQRGEQTENLF
jgi:L-asparaginase